MSVGEAIRGGLATATGKGVAIRVKVVPGASRTTVAGVLGDRLKLKVAAPPEAGKANRAVCDLMAQVLGVAPRDVEVTEGHTTPRKTVTITGVSLCVVAERLDVLLES